MKKIVLSMLVILGFMTIVNAQTAPLKEYTGKYVFGSNSLGINESIVELNESTLSVSSPMGTFVLEKVGVDSFMISQYGAQVIFKRGVDKNVESVSIAVQGMELVGKKEAPTPTSGTKEEEIRMELVAEKLLD